MKIKRTLALLLALVMLFGMMPTVALAEEVAIDETTGLPEGVSAVHAKVGTPNAFTKTVDGVTTTLTAENPGGDTTTSYYTADDGAIVLKSSGYPASSGSVYVQFEKWDGDSDISYQYIPCEDLVRDGEYHTYKIDDVAIPANYSHKRFLFRWGTEGSICWSYQYYSSAVADALNKLAGKVADMYLSMKIVDEVLENDDGTTSTLSTYYINEITAVDDCKNHVADTD